MEEYLKIGAVISTHGLKGEVKVFPTTDDVRRYDDLDEVYAAPPQAGSERQLLHVEHVRYFKNLVIVKFKGIDRIEDVQCHLKKDLFVARKDAIKLEEGQYFVGDIIGLDVFEDTGRKLGKVKDVLATGANDVYIVTPEDDPKKELLLPVIREVILGVDLEAGTMTVHLIPGLED